MPIHARRPYPGSGAFRALVWISGAFRSPTDDSHEQDGRPIRGLARLGTGAMSQKHRVAIAEEAISLVDGMTIGPHDGPITRES